ncbi:MAG: hypothetical protein P8L86_04275 [Gammaproteobacteria bacterium]|nr:hypothetical protein [Gammaproteobacteria bacterium]
MMIKNFLITALLIAQFSTASPLTDGALRLIQIGSEIGSRDIVMRGQSLLMKGAFDLNDFDAIYETSKQMRYGNTLMGYQPQPRVANEILIKLVRQSHDPALYDYALYLLDGKGGFVKNDFLALNLFEESFEVHGNADAAFIAAVIRNESLVPGTKDERRIGELITFAVLNKVKGASEYQAQYIDSGHWRSLNVRYWKDWLASQ